MKHVYMNANVNLKENMKITYVTMYPVKYVNPRNNGMKCEYKFSIVNVIRRFLSRLMITMLVLFIPLYCRNGHQVTNVLHNWSTAHIFTRYCNRIVNFDSDKVE